MVAEVRTKLAPYFQNDVMAAVACFKQQARLESRRSPLRHSWDHSWVPWHFVGRDPL